MEEDEEATEAETMDIYDYLEESSSRTIMASYSHTLANHYYHHCYHHLTR